MPVMDGDLQRSVGKRLKQIRMELGLSQEAFARHIGVHRTYMGAIERGERNLTLRSLERIAARLRVDPATLLAPEAPRRKD